MYSFLHAVLIEFERPDAINLIWFRFGGAYTISKNQ